MLLSPVFCHCYKFVFFILDDFTEELLESHDLEVKNMKAHYTENKDLYEKIAKRQVLWGEYLEFEVCWDGCC